MKLGAENKKKLMIMAVLLVVAIPLVIYNFSSLTGSAAAPPTVTPPPPATAGHASESKAAIPKVRGNTQDPTLRTDILAASQKIEYNGGSRNIFQMMQPEVKIEAPKFPARPQPPQPPVPYDPPKPQIPLKYYGFSNRPGEGKKAFLQDGDNLFMAVEGDVVERRYKIMKITNSAVLVEDMLNNNQQRIDLTLPQTSG